MATSEDERDTEERRRRRFMTVDDVVSAILDEQIRKHTLGDWIGAPLSRTQMLRALVVRGALCTCRGGQETGEPRAATDRRRRVVEVDSFVLDAIDEQIEKHELNAIRTRLRRCQMMRRLVLKAARCTCRGD